MNKEFDFATFKIVTHFFSIGSEEMRDLRNEIEVFSKTHNLLEDIFLSCRTKYEELNERNRLLDKQFKSSFLLSAPSQAVVDQAYRVFR